MMDTGSLPVRTPAEARSSRPAGRETTVDELFAATGPLPVYGAASEAPVLIVDDDVLVEGEDDEVELPAGVSRSRFEVAIEDLRRSERLQVVADRHSPSVLLGVLWLVVGALCLAVHRFAAVAVFATVAGVGAVQTAAALRRVGDGPRPLLAGGCALAIVAAATAPSSRLVGLAVLVAVAASLIGGLHMGGFDAVAASGTVRSWLGIALAGAVPVVLAGAEPSLGVLLFLLACAYDAGDHLVRAAAASWYEAPLAGAVGVLAVGFAAVVFQPGGLSQHSLWPAIIVATVTCPLGPVVASLTLPRGAAFAPALRRLDSLIVVAPLWVLLFS